MTAPALQRVKAIILRPAIAIGTVAVTWMSLIPEAAASVYDGRSISDGLTAISGVGGIAGNTSITDLILKVIGFILDIILLVAVLAIIVAGVYLIAGNGDDGQKDKAKKIIFYVIAGILLILLSRAIVIVINNIF